MTNINAEKLSKNLSEYLNQAIIFNDVININTAKGNAIIISEEEYNSLLETLYLMSIPEMVESIKAGEAEPLDKCTVYKPGEEW